MTEQNYMDKYRHLPEAEICGESTDEFPVYKVYLDNDALLLRCPSCKRVHRYEKQEYVKGDVFRTALICSCGRAERCYLHNAGKLSELEEE